MSNLSDVQQFKKNIEAFKVQLAELHRNIELLQEEIEEHEVHDGTNYMLQQVNNSLLKLNIEIKTIPYDHNDYQGA